MARRFIRPVRTGSTRKSLWLEVPFGSDTLSGTNAVLSGSLNAAALALRPFTIVRTHFHMLLESDQAGAVETQFGALGLIVVTTQATAIGVTAVPIPATNLASDWFAHRMFSGNGVNLTDLTSPAQSYDLDSKAMRKVDIGEDMVIVIENPTARGFSLSSMGRILIKTN